MGAGALAILSLFLSNAPWHSEAARDLKSFFKPPPRNSVSTPDCPVSTLLSIASHWLQFLLLNKCFGNQDIRCIWFCIVCAARWLSDICQLRSHKCNWLWSPPNLHASSSSSSAIGLSLLVIAKCSKFLSRMTEGVEDAYRQLLHVHERNRSIKLSPSSHVPPTRKRLTSP